MSRLLTAIDWIDNLHLRAMSRKTRHLTATVDGDGRDATWQPGVGIYVSGHDVRNNNTVKIDGAPYEMRDIWWM